MPQWSAAVTSRSYEGTAVQGVAMKGKSDETPRPGLGLRPETEQLCQSLMLQLPGIDWTVEVDLFGQHRVTLHFKGLDIQIDE